MSKLRLGGGSTAPGQTGRWPLPSAAAVLWASPASGSRGSMAWLCFSGPKKMLPVKAEPPGMITRGWEFQCRPVPNAAWATLIWNHSPAVYLTFHSPWRAGQGGRGHPVALRGRARRVVCARRAAARVGESLGQTPTWRGRGQSLGVARARAWGRGQGPESQVRRRAQGLVLAVAFRRPGSVHSGTGSRRGMGLFLWRVRQDGKP